MTTCIEQDPSTSDGARSAGAAKRVLIVYNTMLYIARLRRDLIITLQQCGHEVVAVAPSDAAQRDLEALKVKCIDWPLIGHSLNPLHECMALYRLYVIVRRIRPDSLLLFTIKPIIYGSLAARLLGIRRVYSMVTGLGVLFVGQSLKARLLRLAASTLYRHTLRHNLAVFVQNAEHQRLLADSGFCRPDRVVRINGSGVNLVDFQPHHADCAESTTAAAPTFFMASRLLRHKGVLEYIEAARCVVKDCPKAVFWLAGSFVEGPSSIDEATLTASLNGSGVRFLGDVDDMPKRLAAASVFVLPSRYPEGIPRVLLEALACGLPIITTDSAGCRETVESGVNGLLVSASSDQATLVQALSDAMVRLCDNPQQRRQMGLASRRLAERKFDVHEVNHSILSVMSLDSPGTQTGS